jgi:hypothetical protein
MSDRNTLLGLKITMKKHPESLKLEGYLKEKLEKNDIDYLILYDGIFLYFILCYNILNT